VVPNGITNYPPSLNFPLQLEVKRRLFFCHQNLEQVDHHLPEIIFSERFLKSQPGGRQGFLTRLPLFDLLQLERAIQLNFLFSRQINVLYSLQTAFSFIF
jgi:hypothetical protein